MELKREEKRRRISARLRQIYDMGLCISTWSPFDRIFGVTASSLGDNFLEAVIETET